MALIAKALFQITFIFPLGSLTLVSIFHSVCFFAAYFSLWLPFLLVNGLHVLVQRPPAHENRQHTILSCSKLASPSSFAYSTPLLFSLACSLFNEESLSVVRRPVCGGPTLLQSVLSSF